MPAPIAKQPVCFAAGRMWDEAKNLTLLERIAPQLDWPVRVAGSGAGSQHVHPQLRALGKLPHRDVLHHLNAASIFVHPALYEPFGLSVLEAARCRCCLVLSDIESLRELWNGAALFVDPRDPEQWIAELNRLARDPFERDELGRAAAARAQRYDAAGSIARYVDLYRSLLPSPQQAEKGAAA